ncbi:whey acidic protein-like [Mus pahari]|uniref:whey acidic protein-like n=1 Tax=Mus pahari TaxID=10093 RepID=UPI000A30E97D|nr:whey acidic protein-like [Mus pahari]
MRCFISLVLGLLALEVALARNLQDQVFNSVPSMFPDGSPIVGTECVNCQTNEECARNAMCCPNSCGKSCKTPVNTKSPPIGVTKAGICPWDLLQTITAGPCPKKISCSSDSQCPGNMKCCIKDCIMTCVDPVPGMQLQDPGPPLLPRPLAPTLPYIRSKSRYSNSPSPFRLCFPRPGSRYASQSRKPELSKDGDGRDRAEGVASVLQPSVP